MQIQYVNDKSKEIYAVELNSPLRFLNEHSLDHFPAETVIIFEDSSMENVDSTESNENSNVFTKNNSKVICTDKDDCSTGNSIELNENDSHTVGCSAQDVSMSHLSKDADTNGEEDGATGWHSCSICLEDTFDDDLLVHSICGGMMCKGCLKATSDFHGNLSFPCPVTTNSFIILSSHLLLMTFSPKGRSFRPLLYCFK